MTLEYDTQGAAHYVGVARQTLEKWRVAGGGPVFYKIGALVRYRQADLDAWLDSRRRRSTSDHGQQ